jgi:hypothetical protein
MAMFLFTVLIGLGFVFLAYVLIEFGKEGRRPMSQAASSRVIEFLATRKPTVVVVTEPMTPGGRAGLSVISRKPTTSEPRLHRWARSIQ